MPCFQRRLFNAVAALLVRFIRNSSFFVMAMSPFTKATESIGNTIDVVRRSNILNEETCILL